MSAPGLCFCGQRKTPNDPPCSNCEDPPRTMVEMVRRETVVRRELLLMERWLDLVDGTGLGLVARDHFEKAKNELRKSLGRIRGALS